MTLWLLGNKITKGLIMKQDKNIEQLLLNDEKYEKFIKDKAEQDFNKIIKDARANKFPRINCFHKKLRITLSTKEVKQPLI